MDQLKFGFANKPQFSESDFVISTSNREAFFWIKKWPEWPGNSLLLYGTEGSGKTHLANIWSNKTRARFIKKPGEVLGFSNLEALVMENIEFCDEDELFHLLNQAKENKISLLLTSSLSLEKLSFKLPDLISRIKAMQSIGLNAPDDALLKSVITKLFSDRQLKVPLEVINYLSSQIERSFKAAGNVVEKIDNLSALEKRNITVPLVKRVL